MIGKTIRHLQSCLALRIQLLRGLHAKDNSLSVARLAFLGILFGIALSAKGCSINGMYSGPDCSAMTISHGKVKASQVSKKMLVLCDTGFVYQGPDMQCQRLQKFCNAEKGHHLCEQAFGFDLVKPSKTEAPETSYVKMPKQSAQKLMTSRLTNLTKGAKALKCKRNGTDTISKFSMDRSEEVIEILRDASSSGWPFSVVSLVAVTTLALVLVMTVRVPQVSAAVDDSDLSGSDSETSCPDSETSCPE